MNAGLPNRNAGKSPRPALRAFFDTMQEFDVGSEAETFTSCKPAILAGEAMTEPLWLIDGFNLLHACILRGRDRSNWWCQVNQREVAHWVEPLAKSQEVWLVFDAREPQEAPWTEVSSASVHFAPDADEFIVRQAEAHAGERPVHVVTADRSLRDRARRYGVHPIRPWEFERLLTEME